jgi:hypothetical protein
VPWISSTRVLPQFVDILRHDGDGNESFEPGNRLMPGIGNGLGHRLQNGQQEFAQPSRVAGGRRQQSGPVGELLRRKASPEALVVAKGGDAALGAHTGPRKDGDVASAAEGVDCGLPAGVGKDHSEPSVFPCGASLGRLA